MAETIFLLNNAGELVEMTEAHYLTENDLQKLLADYPKLISGEQIDINNPRRWLLISREMGVADALTSGNRWSLDHLFIDQEGIPTLVEVKRSTDTRLRREVIGQILDYAANAVSYWSIDEIIIKFESTCSGLNKIPQNVLNDFLTDGYYKENFWDIVQTNLKAGKIRLLLIADIIPKEMQRIIEFLNEQMSPCEILGLEIKQFVGESLKTLVPRVVGRTISAQAQKSVKTNIGSQWNEERFFADVLVKDQKHFEIYRSFYQRSLTLFDHIWWGSGNKTGSFIPNLKINGMFIQLFGVYTGGIELQFQWLKTKKPFNDNLLRNELLSKINSALGTQIRDIDKRPNIKPEIFELPGALDAFFDVAKWYVEMVRNHYRVDTVQ